MRCPNCNCEAMNFTAAGEAQCSHCGLDLTDRLTDKLDEILEAANNREYALEFLQAYVERRAEWD